MGLMSEEFKNLHDLFMHGLCDVYDAELRLVDALPKVIDAANGAELKSMFEEHLQQTRTHCKRLEEVFSKLGKDPDRVTCYGMKGLINECDVMADATGDAYVRDAGILSAAQRVEHYEIAAYDDLIDLATEIGLPEVAHILEQTLHEEEDASRKLLSLAESRVSVAPH